jgi:preprotein translocase subunit SecG
MENVVLVIHLLLALGLIGVVLLQRSEGGGLGLGGGGGAITGRSATTALGKVTWGLAVAFIVTSLALTIIARQNAATASVIDGLAAEDTGTAPVEADLGEGSLLPPTAEESQPLVPQAGD